MKNLVWAVVAMAIGTCTIVACEKEKDHQEGETRQLEDRQKDNPLLDSLRSSICPRTTNTFLLSDAPFLEIWDTLYVINTHEEFDSLFPACEFPEDINLDNQTLIVAMGESNYTLLNITEPAKYHQSGDTITAFFSVNVVSQIPNSGSWCHMFGTPDKWPMGRVAKIYAYSGPFHNGTDYVYRPLWGPVLRTVNK